MVKRDTERVRGGVRKTGARALRILSAEEREPHYWSQYAREHRDMVSFDSKGAVFAPGTPQRVLDSYKLWEEKRAAKKRGQ